VLVRDGAIHVTLLPGYVLLLPLDGLITVLARLGDFRIAVRFGFRNVALHRGRRFRLIARSSGQPEDEYRSDRDESLHECSPCIAVEAFHKPLMQYTRQALLCGFRHSLWEPSRGCLASSSDATLLAG